MTKWLIIAAAAGGGFLYLRSQGYDLSTSAGWSKLFGNGGMPVANPPASPPAAGGGASPCQGCRNAATTPTTYAPITMGS